MPDDAVALLLDLLQQPIGVIAGDERDVVPSVAANPHVVDCHRTRRPRRVHVREARE